MSTKRPKRVICVWAVLFWLIVWQIAATALNSRLLLVSPIEVLVRLGQLVLEPSFWKAIGISLLHISEGFLLGVGFGVLFALLSARYIWIGELLSPLLSLIKAVPVASFIILALILFSSEYLSVFISFLMVLPLIYDGVLQGIHSLDVSMKEMADIFQIPAARRFRYIELPQILPYFQAACASALGLCWKSGIAAEVIGMPSGTIGAMLQQAKVYLDTPDLFAWTVVIVLISFLFEKVFVLLMKKGMAALERMD